MEILAEEFTVAGHQVKVATQVATKVERDRDYEIVRLPILKSCVADCAHFCGRQSSGTYDSPSRFSILSEFKKTVDDSLRAGYRSCAQVHLARHSRSEVARSYLRVLESAARLG
jgi:hypothetical protein